MNRTRMSSRASSPLLLALVAMGSGASCTLYVNGVLDDAEENVVAEGEGEGEGEAGEGEGEGEGEPSDDDPACEAFERLLVVRDESVDSLQVYDLDNGAIQRRFPEGSNTNVNLDNDDANAQNNGFGASGVAIGSDDRLYITGNRFLYQFEASTLTQETITGRTQLTVQAFSRVNRVEMLGRRIVTFGGDVHGLLEGSPALTDPDVLQTGDDYLSTTSFRIGDIDHVAASAQLGYVVISSRNDEPPTVTGLDTEFDTDRIHSFGSGSPPKGIAFDVNTQKLLLGDEGRVIVIPAQGGFVMPEDDDGDFVLDGVTTQVKAIAARGGFAYVVLGRGVDNLIKLDLSQSPPVAVSVATVDGIGSFARDISVGCRRLFISHGNLPNSVVARNRNTLAPAGQLNITKSQQVRVVKKAALGLLGDD